MKLMKVSWRIKMSKKNASFIYLFQLPSEAFFTFQTISGSISGLFLCDRCFILNLFNVHVFIHESKHQRGNQPWVVWISASADERQQTFEKTVDITWVEETKCEKKKSYGRKIKLWNILVRRTQILVDRREEPVMEVVQNEGNIKLNNSSPFFSLYKSGL